MIIKVGWLTGEHFNIWKPLLEGDLSRVRGELWLVNAVMPPHLRGRWINHVTCSLQYFFRSYCNPVNTVLLHPEGPLKMQLNGWWNTNGDDVSIFTTETNLLTHRSLLFFCNWKKKWKEEEQKKGFQTFNKHSLKNKCFVTIISMIASIKKSRNIKSRDIGRIIIIVYIVWNKFELKWRQYLKKTLICLKIVC